MGPHTREGQTWVTEPRRESRVAGGMATGGFLPGSEPPLLPVELPMMMM